MWSKKLLILPILLASVFVVAEDVRILPLRGPIGTAKIAPGNMSSTAYRMDFPGQAAICFQSAASTVVYLSSSSSIGANGWGLYNKGENLCVDLAGGTTIYAYGASSGGDVRAVFAR